MHAATAPTNMRNVTPYAAIHLNTCINASRAPVLSSLYIILSTYDVNNVHVPTLLEEFETFDVSFIVQFSDNATLVVETVRIFVTFSSCCKATVVIKSWGGAILFKI